MNNPISASDESETGPEPSPNSGPVRTDAPGSSSDNDWNYIIGIKLFQQKPHVGSATLTVNLNEFPPEQALPGELIQAARTLLAMSQSDLSTAAAVSKKLINDYENRFIAPKQAIVGRLRAALELQGARFIGKAGCMGVMTVAPEPVMTSRSRSPRLSGSTPPSTSTSSGRARGRPFKSPE